HFKQSLHFYLQKTVSGSKRYRDYFKMIPDTKIKYQIDITPVSNLQLSFNAVYRSSVQWKEFAAVDGKKYHLPAGIPIGDFKRRFYTKIPGFINIGAGVKKGLFNNHLRAQLRFQNILDQKVRYHAIGDVLFLIVHFKVSF